MRAIYFYETSRLCEPFFPTAMLEQRSVPIALRDCPSATADRWQLFCDHVGPDEVLNNHDIVPLTLLETTVHSSVRQPELPSSDRSEVHFKCERRAGTCRF